MRSEVIFIGSLCLSRVIGVLARSRRLLIATSVLMMIAFATSAVAEQFSIKCPYGTYYFVTFDTDTGKVVYEMEAGTALKGNIDKIEGERIHFHLLKIGEPAFQLTWNSSQKKLVWLSTPEESKRREVTSTCSSTELRSFISKYDDIAPY
jgi:hypothetical protein